MPSSATVSSVATVFSGRTTTTTSSVLITDRLSLPLPSSSPFIGRQLIQSINQHRNTTTTFKRRRSTVTMEWQNCTVRMEIDVPISVAYNCYLDREATPQWMPFISSVKMIQSLLEGHSDKGLKPLMNKRECIIEFTVFNERVYSFQILEDKPELSRWSLKYTAFGHDLEFSWLARNMQPIPNQKIHWRSLEGLPNRGVIRFFPKDSSSCLVELTVSYEVPQILSPIASALQPFNESLIRRGLERFANYARTCQLDSV